MPQNAPDRESFAARAWLDLKTTRAAWTPWVLGYAVVLFATNFITPMPANQTPEQMRLDPHILKNLLVALPSLALIILASLIANYLLITNYLRAVIPVNPPKASLANFRFWAKHIFIKFLRPFWWCLLPIVGIFFYAHALFRRAPVSAMAALGQKDITQRSWNLTKGNVWRILWGSLVLNAKTAFFAFLASLPLIAIVWAGAYALHVDPGTGLAFGQKLISSFISAIVAQANVIYSCVVLRTLLKEKKAAAAPPTPPNEKT